MTFEEMRKLLINPRNTNLMRSSLKEVNGKVVDISTNILLWNEEEESKWLDEMGFESEDCGIFPGIRVDYIEYEEGNTEGCIGINGVSYTFELDFIFDTEDEISLFTESENDIIIH